ncbi:MAG: LytR/AlgR family response regulator transcription factor [Candidatus Dormibacteria bacterium]
MIRVAVIDDEPHARFKLVKLIDAEPDLDLVGEYGTGAEALKGITQQRPDLIFLDIQMPDLDGFRMLETLDTRTPPYVIFTTAYTEYATKAFEFEAIDYLLKPFDVTRFQKAVDKSRRIINQAPRHSDPRAGIEHLETIASHLGNKSSNNRLLVKLGTKIRFLDAYKIRHIQAAGDFLKVAINDEVLLIRERMQAMEGRLTPGTFIRIHRSALINLDFVKEMKAKQHGDYEFIMLDGERFLSSARYRASIRLILSSLKTNWK